MQGLYWVQRHFCGPLIMHYYLISLIIRKSLIIYPLIHINNHGPSSISFPPGTYWHRQLAFNLITEPPGHYRCKTLGLALLKICLFSSFNEEVINKKMRETCLIQGTVLRRNYELTNLSQYLDLMKNMGFMIDYSSLTFHLLESCIFSYVLDTVPCH